MKRIEHSLNIGINVFWHNHYGNSIISEGSMEDESLVRLNNILNNMQNQMYEDGYEYIESGGEMLFPA